MDNLNDHMKEFVKNTNRQTKIDRLVEQVDAWDLECLIGYCKDSMRAALDSAADKDLDFDYLMVFEYEIADAVVELMEEEQVPQLKEVCDCPLDIGGIIHAYDCPEYSKTE